MLHWIISITFEKNGISMKINFGQGCYRDSIDIENVSVEKKQQRRHLLESVRPFRDPLQ